MSVPRRTWAAFSGQSDRPGLLNKGLATIGYLVRLGLAAEKPCNERRARGAGDEEGCGEEQSRRDRHGVRYEQRQRIMKRQLPQFLFESRQQPADLGPKGPEIRSGHRIPFLPRVIGLNPCAWPDRSE